MRVLKRHCSFYCGFLVLTMVMPIGTASAADYDPAAGKAEVGTLETIWHDKSRDRDVPVKIYYPKSVYDKSVYDKSANDKSAGSKSPVIIFSHGLGGSREGYGYLGNYWAAHGYVSVHLTHKGSDTDAIREEGLENLKQTGLAIASDPINALDRVKDVGFAIDQMTHLNKDEQSPLHGKLDLDHIGMAGHSFGAGTTMLVSGEQSHRGNSYVDDRITCAIAMSPPQTAAVSKLNQAFAEVKIPVFVMTGTKDDSPIGETKAADRRVGFDHVNSAAYLLTFDGGDHMLFSANHRRPKWPTDDRNHELILQGSTAFWDAYLRNDNAAKKWLSGGAFSKAVGDSGKLEERNLKPKP